jgi:YD repeat-containing protein
MNKKILFRVVIISLLAVKDVRSIAQADNHSQIAVLKNIVPPSPNSSSLGKYGEWPVSLYTGVPNVSVPVCELKGRTISVPVSLSYHASGNKVGDIPSWVGLGWSLNAGGAVTRSIKGLPDEDGYFDNTTNYTNPNDFSSAPLSQNTLSQTIVASAKNGTDTQEDIYNLSVLGKSYKFILKADGTMQTIPASSVKLIANPIAGTNRTANTWTILLEDGTRLLFGGGTNYEEITSNPKFTLPDGSGITFRSSWMLQSITTTSNEVITFTYTQASINQDSYYSQSDFIEYKLSFATPNPDGSFPPPTSCVPVTHSFSTKTSIEKQDVISLNLATIESDLGRLEFIQNSTARQDLPGSKALQEIKLFSKPANKYIEHYILTTGYSTASSSNVLTTPATINDTYVNYRLRLNSLEKKDVNNPAALGQKWIFDYNPQNLPARRSFAQDHWGFFNGAISNTTLLPQVYYTVPVSTYGFFTGQSPVNIGFMPLIHTSGGNREGNANYLQAEMLTSIRYPTGGSSNFTYEPNSIVVNEETFTSTSIPLVLNMYASQSPPSNTVTATFTITKPQYIHVSATSFISQIILNDRPNAKTTTEILNQSGMSIASFTNTGDKWFNLYLPGTYTFQVSSNVSPSEITVGTINVNATLEYAQSNGIQSFNKLVGGLRINKIADYDGISSNSVNEKSFVYESPFVINPVDIQSDYLTSQDKLTKDSQSGETCDFITITRNTSSRFALGAIQGGTVAYGKVTTLNGLNGANGKTVSLFSNEEDAGTAAAKVFPYVSPDSRDHRRGLLLEETHYKSDLITPLKKTANAYSFNTIGYITGFKAGYSTIIDPSLCFNIYGLCGITTRFTTTTSEQVKRLTSAETTYDMSGQNPLTTITNNFYDNANNFSPTRIETTDSKGNIIKSISRGPLEKADINAATPLTPTASAAIDTMLARNIISQTLQQEQHKANVLQSRSLINYKNWTTTILQPENVQVQLKNNPIETRVRFNAYDNLGNLSEQQKENDVKQAYIYGYNKNYPVAQVIGADYATISALVNQTVLDNPLSTDAQIRTELNNLRTGLANTKALVTTYTYKPLIGITSQTDPNGRTTYYEYDAYNRVVLIRDKDNNIIKKICYNYAGQPEACNFLGNAIASQTFTRNNCVSGSTGSSVTYTVPANTYTAATQQDANAMAQADINANGQAYANANGTCSGASVTLKSQNNTFISGFTAVYTNVSTGAQSSFGISSSTSLITMGTLPAGTYNITISKSGNNTIYIFGVYNNSCTLTTVSGKTASFFNIVLSPSSTCNGFQIDTNL